ncbi:unnamed protein product [Blepharisma stoltei]|uniref:Uncharacterized protein n=1 Tax=Blepharisma stoltei TaxID=1481888 RepID=A0AAU9ITQ7_9CILI|nr:unnamed protein product [Blepharisma stoltei]
MSTVAFQQSYNTDENFFLKTLSEIQKVGQEELEALPHKTLINLLKISILGMKYFTEDLNKDSNELGEDVSDFIAYINEYASKREATPNCQKNCENDAYKGEIEIKRQFEELKEKYDRLKLQNDEISKEVSFEYRYGADTKYANKYKHYDRIHEKELKIRENICEELEMNFKKLFEDQSFELADVDESKSIEINEAANCNIEEGEINDLSCDEGVEKRSVLKTKFKRKKIKQAIECRAFKDIRSISELDFSIKSAAFQDGKQLCQIKLRKNDIKEADKTKSFKKGKNKVRDDNPIFILVEGFI